MTSDLAEKLRLKYSECSGIHESFISAADAVRGFKLKGLSYEQMLRLVS